MAAMVDPNRVQQADNAGPKKRETMNMISSVRALNATGPSDTIAKRSNALTGGSLNDFTNLNVINKDISLHAKKNQG
jgi:hypothetical protein